MKPKSIIYKDIVNLENCESEPIHVPGSIQPHGVLIATDENFQIQFCSANIEEYDLKASAVLQQNLTDLFDERQMNIINQLLAGIDDHTRVIEHILWQNSFFAVFAHRSKDQIIIELEKAINPDEELPFLNSLSFEFARYSAEAKNLKELSQKISQLIKSITGYDRVMIYKFDEDYNGEVFAESCEEHLEPFLGLHYPHTDIPPQARALYMRNLVRMITDVTYEPVPILTMIEDTEHHSLDLGLAGLRSVSPIHVDYLKNMGVGATLTVSLIHEDRLWGLIACHHYSPKHLSYYGRISSLFNGNLFSSQIRVQETAVNFDLKVKLEKHLNEVNSILNEDTTLDFDSEHFYKLTRSDGFYTVSDQRVIRCGELAKHEDVDRLFEVLKAKNLDYFCSRSVKNDLDFNADNISGVLFYRLDLNTYVMWLRQEMKEEVKWAGNPNKAIEKDINGLSPRKSFKAWKEIISNKSRPWKEVEKEMANSCIYQLQKHFSYLQSIKVQKQQEELVEKLQKANDELENLNWISAHDLKEPLRKIRIFSSILTDGRYELDSGTLKMINRINNSAGRMQRLLDDLLNLNRTKHIDAPLSEVCLEGVLRKIGEENDGVEHINYQIEPGLPLVQGHEILLQQLFSNLLDNAIKFARPKVKLTVNVSSRELDEGFVEISFKDNGQGFDNQYAENMFKVFHRLNDNTGIEGSGVGLAICKKVAEIHNGSIRAEGETGKGAQFFIKLPKA
ncbi:ATP-binding protein [Jiulongibacter sp. NS-SX5]|uniref:ATP-binding protein n=1 Tax=Jiulongibacter sp. NS-SX5 TaxID=3463854 RepID=UPI0040596552